MTTQEQIEQVKHNLITNQTELKELRIQRAQLALNKGSVAELAKLDKQIDALVRNIENGPATVAVLEDKLKEQQAQAAQTERDQLLSQQKSCAGQMEAISKKLVAALEVANDLNIQLDTVTRRYVALQKQTNQDVIMKAVCWPSEQMLKVIFETLSAEFGGQVPQRITGVPPFVRI